MKKGIIILVFSLRGEEEEVYQELVPVRYGTGITW
jgi:hypothetical protein